MGIRKNLEYTAVKFKLKGKDTKFQRKEYNFTGKRTRRVAEEVFDINLGGGN
jgi:hypothetical protein